MLKDILIKNEGRLLLFLIILHIIPIWFFDNFSTVDGWTHSYNTFLLNEYFFGQFQDFSNIYQVNKSYDPNWFINIFQLLISKIFSFWANDKLILSLYIVFFPISLRYAIRSVNKEAGFISILSIPFIYSMSMFLGFFGYLLSLPIAFMLVGYFIRNSHQWNRTSIVVFSIGSMFLYFAHIIGFGLTFIALGLFSIAHFINYSMDTSSPNKVKFVYNKEALKNYLVIPFLAALPTLFLVFIFLSHRTPSTGSSEVFQTLSSSSLVSFLALFNEPVIRLKELFLLHLYQPFTTKAGIFSIPLALLMFSLFVYYVRDKVRNKKIVILDVLFIILIVKLLLYLGLPNLSVETDDGQKYGGWMKHRVLPYLLAFSILLFALIKYSIWQKRTLIVTTTLLALGLFLTNLHYFKLVDQQLDEYFSGNHVYEPNSTFLSITGKQGGHLSDGESLSPYIKLFSHAASKIALEKRLVYLENVEAKFFYYAIQYKKDKNPFDLLDSPSMIMPRTNILTYEKETGIPIDYISIWLGRKAINPTTGKLEDDMVSLYKQLDANVHYEKIFTSENQLLEIYKRRSDASLLITDPLVKY